MVASRITDFLMISAMVSPQASAYFAITLLSVMVTGITIKPNSDAESGEFLESTDGMPGLLRLEPDSGLATYPLRSCNLADFIISVMH